MREFIKVLLKIQCVLNGRCLEYQLDVEKLLRPFVTLPLMCSYNVFRFLKLIEWFENFIRYINSTLERAKWNNTLKFLTPCESCKSLAFKQREGREQRPVDRCVGWLVSYWKWNASLSVDLKREINYWKRVIRSVSRLSMNTYTNKQRIMSLAKSLLAWTTLDLILLGSKGKQSSDRGQLLALQISRILDSHFIISLNY